MVNDLFYYISFNYRDDSDWNGMYIQPLAEALCENHIGRSSLWRCKDWYSLAIL